MRRNKHKRTQLGEIYLQSLLFLFCFTLSSLLISILKVICLEVLLMPTSALIKPGFCGQELLSLQDLLVKKREKGEAKLFQLFFFQISQKILKVTRMCVSLSPRNFIFLVF